MSLGDEMSKKVAYQFTYEELEVLDRAARELGLRDAEGLLRDVLHKTAQVRQQEARQPRTPEDPTLKLEAPGLGSGPDVNARGPSGRAQEKVEGKSRQQLLQHRPSLASRAFRAAREHDRER